MVTCFSECELWFTQFIFYYALNWNLLGQWQTFSLVEASTALDCWRLKTICSDMALCLCALAQMALPPSIIMGWRVRLWVQNTLDTCVTNLKKKIVQIWHYMFVFMSYILSFQEDMAIVVDSIIQDLTITLLCCNLNEAP